MKRIVIILAVFGLICSSQANQRGIKSQVEGASDKVKNTKTRTIHFPKDRSLGALYVGQLRGHRLSMGKQVPWFS